MQNEILTDIMQYMESLRSIWRLDVSFSAYDSIFKPYWGVLLQYEIHTNPYCSFLKTNHSTKGLCIRQKQKLAARQFAAPFYGCCYAGVEEYVIPLFCRGKRLANIHITGYRGKLPSSGPKRLHVKEKYGIPARDFDALYQAQLQAAIPDAAFVLQAVKPLFYMFGSLYEQARTEQVCSQQTMDLYRATIAYACDHYAEKITGKELSENLFFSESYIRHIFREHSGETFGQFLLHLRLDKSSQLLLYSNLSVSAIAAAAGFGDANYFSFIFKKEKGLAPLQYRKNGVTAPRLEE